MVKSTKKWSSWMWVLWLISFILIIGTSAIHVHEMYYNKENYISRSEFDKESSSLKNDFTNTSIKIETNQRYVFSKRISESLSILNERFDDEFIFQNVSPNLNVTFYYFTWYTGEMKCVDVDPDLRVVWKKEC